MSERNLCVVFVLERRIPWFVGIVGFTGEGQLRLRQMRCVLNNWGYALCRFIDTFLRWIRNSWMNIELTHGCDNGRLDGNCRRLDLAQEFVKAGILVKSDRKLGKKENCTHCSLKKLVHRIHYNCMKPIHDVVF